MKNIALILSLFAIVVLAACSTKIQHQKEEKFKVASPLVKDTVYTSEYVAELNAIQNVEIRTRIKGYIETIRVDEGQNVKKGQTLFSVSSRRYQQDLRKAKANLKSVLAELKSAEIELESSRTLLKKNIIAQTEYDLAAAKVDALNAKLEEAESEEAQAKLNLSFAEIKAPFDGIINRIPYKTGSLVEEGTLLTTLSNNKEVYAYFNVAEKDYLDYVITKGGGKSKEVDLVLANGSVYAHKGIIETTESEFDKSTGNIAFRAKFPNPEQILKHGATGKVQVSTALKNAMLISQKSTFEIQGNVYVYVVDKNNVVQMRKITPTVRWPHLYAIGAGLSPSDKFIYEGIQRVKEVRGIK
ncbi:membrane fusion protein, multidrug efflux system [Flexibacter flexilis DSM 6793]|uniref:Membrane fusion protein, multidrug efflux system n=1 Tax=Flexibacter flexilis DSM 6793 TaxID=927664 RepID=A0A1I1E3F8_9BACT|nr:efflux RND transporter periplasmic adaptor subunit [Flexibacter flexilis]SFB81186.1 membrane fusion protein, multidrug efflux system [Flexibacter flexilis DSM 6793]